MDEHYIVYKKDNTTRAIEPVTRFVCESQAYGYFSRLGVELIRPSDVDWGDDLFPDDMGR